MLISTKPMTGAMYLSPWEREMMRMVPRETSQSLAQKIRMGRIIHLKRSEA